MNERAAAERITQGEWTEEDLQIVARAVLATPEEQREAITEEALKPLGFEFGTPNPRWQKILASCEIDGSAHSAIIVEVAIDDHVNIAKRGRLGEMCYLREGFLKLGDLLLVLRALGISLPGTR